MNVGNDSMYKFVKDAAEKLTTEPELSEQAKEFINSSDRSEDFKAFQAGHSQGKKDGFNKGVATTLVAVTTIGLLGAIIFKNK